MTDGNSEEVAHGGSEEEAAWLDLVGRFDAPATAGDAPVPWPESENLTPPAASPPLAPPPLPAAPRAIAPGPASGGVVPVPAPVPAPAEEEHYVPPPPPPLPRLSPLTKGAWVALFGGPGYLLAATMAGWTIPGWLGFGAVAAFIGGFIVLVLHVGDDHDRDSGSGRRRGGLTSAALARSAAPTSPASAPSSAIMMSA